MALETFTYVNKLVNEFYKFMGDIYIEYKLAETSITQTFTDYFLYKLFYNYGIKRRMVNEKIALLFYDKNCKGYKPFEPITILCRHMLLDINIMKIVSLGIPKSISLDEFCNTYEIDKTNAGTNFLINNANDTTANTTATIEKYRLYKFSEGTMLTYNPSLKKYSITEINTNINSDDNEMDIDIDESTKELLSSNIEVKFNKQFMYSTRKVIGTGKFNSAKTFFEMFDENNKIANTNLDNIPEEIMNDKVLVFNIEHPENRIVSSQVRNFNTLCAVFQFKNEEIAKVQYNKIMEIEFSIEMQNIILDAFRELGNNMISQIQVANFNKQVQEYNVNLHLPEIIKSFEKLEEDGITKTIINFNELSFESINEIVQNKPKDFQGYIIYGLNGERTKFSNKKYKELRALKGNKPIIIEQKNTKNLFYHYWNLVKNNKVEEFIKEFDINQGSGNNEYMYNKLFNWFLYLVKIYSNHLFKIYHYSFVKKTFEKCEIPFSMKPMCGDLHKLYLKNKVPISALMVEKYIFEQPANKIFWRIFTQNN